MAVVRIISALDLDRLQKEKSQIGEALQQEKDKVRVLNEALSKKEDELQKAKKRKPKAGKNHLREVKRLKTEIRELNEAASKKDVEHAEALSKKEEEILKAEKRKLEAENEYLRKIDRLKTEIMNNTTKVGF